MKHLSQSFLHELNYLGELIKEFPCEKEISAEDAFELIQVRYSELEKKFGVIESSLRNSISETKQEEYTGDDIFRNVLPKYFYDISIILHKYLFDNILSCNGEFRKITDSLNGIVGFGGSSQRIAGNHNFCGTNPKLITKELKRCI